MLRYIYRKLAALSVPWGRKKLVHEIEDGHHRLIYANHGKQGKWAPREDVARLDQYAAVTDEHTHSLPMVFEVMECKDYVTHRFDHDSDDYWMRGKEEPLT